MRIIQNLTSNAFQRHTLLFEESEIILELRYLSIAQIWIMNVEFKDFNIYGLKLACNTLHMESSNMPFDFICIDNSGNGLDPINLNDFDDERVSIYLMESADMVEIRGQSVQI